MDAAGAGEAVDVDRVRPAAGGVRPLPGPAVVADHLAAGDRHAVDHAGRERVELPGQGGDRGLVEQLQARVELTLVEQRLALRDERDRLHVRVAEALAELERELRVCVRLLELPVQHPRAQAARQLEPSVDERLRLTLERPLALRQPAAGDRERSLAQVLDREPKRDLGAPELVVGGRVGAVCALARRERFVEAAAPEGSVGEPLEVAGVELVGERRQRVVRLRPGTAAERQAPGLDRVARDTPHVAIVAQHPLRQHDARARAACRARARAGPCTGRGRRACPPRGRSRPRRPGSRSRGRARGRVPARTP